MIDRVISGYTEALESLFGRYYDPGIRLLLPTWVAGAVIAILEGYPMVGLAAIFIFASWLSMIWIEVRRWSA